MASSTAELDLSPLSDSDVNSPSKRSLETHHKVQSVSQRSLNLKSYNVPRHFSMQSISSVQEAEKTLTQLVGDFEEGKLHAFGDAAVLERMQEVRSMQEALTQKHLAMDSELLKQAAQGDIRQDGRFETGLTDLMSELKELTEAIQKLETPVNTSSAEEDVRSKLQFDGAEDNTMHEEFKDASEEPEVVQEQPPLMESAETAKKDVWRQSTPQGPLESVLPNEEFRRPREPRRISLSPQITEV